MSWILLCLPVLAQAHKAESLAQPAPEPVSKAIRAALAEKGTRISGEGGKPFMDFWLAKTVPSGGGRDDLGVNFGAVKEGGLVGVVRIHGGGEDYRGDRYPSGVYTLRYMVQPEDGDHQGTVESRDFLLLARAKEDTSAGPMDLKKLVKLTTKVSSKKHPAVLYLTEPAGRKAKTPRVVLDEEKDYVLLECAIPLGKEGGKPVRLRIVIVGKSAEF